MGSELIINATLPETRIALLDNGEIQELYIEREAQRGIVGNIYKGRVIRVLPGMQAAFVDIGLEKAAFLYVDDVIFPDMQTPVQMPGGEGSPTGVPGDELVVEAASAERTVEAASAERTVEAASAERTVEAASAERTVEAASAEPEIEVAALDEQPDEQVQAVGAEPDEEPIPRRRAAPIGTSIQDLVREGQEIIVQVAKDPIGTKGARLTCHISLPGRYLVFMPTVDHVGVSRRIENDGERRRLKENILKYRPPGTGFIVRTASSTQDGNKIKTDIEYLVRSWNEVREKFLKSRAPAVVYQDYTLVIRAIRDIMTEEVDRLVVDSRDEYKQIMKFVQRFMPNVRSKIELYDRPSPIFDYFGIELEIARALDRKVWLKSGGYLVIDQSEALVAIDVNTGRFVGKRNLEDTILKTNLEAVKEIAYQLRLRNCGGIVILDLIDMEKESSREKVYLALEEALKKDRARPTILKISQLGLVEMTRKRTRDNIVRTLCEPCPYCEGRGFIKNKITIAYEILREIEREGINRETHAVTIECAPAVCELLNGDQGTLIDQMQRDMGKEIIIRPNIAFHLEQYDVTATRGEKRFTVRESKKDARGLGAVVSISDSLEEQGPFLEEYAGGTSLDEAMEALPFINEGQTAIDGERELREERNADRGRRGRRSPKSAQPARRGGRTDRPDRADRPDRVEKSDRLPKIPVLLNAKKHVLPVALEPEDRGEDFDNIHDDAESDVDSHQDLDEGRQVVAAPSGPRSYEEYIKLAPEAGTELTRAEWESQNYARGNRDRAQTAGGRPSGRHGPGPGRQGQPGQGDPRRGRNHRRVRRGRSRNAKPRVQPHA